MKRILPVAGALAGTLAALLGCGHRATADTTAVLANVNGVRITQAQLEARVRTLSTDPKAVAAFLADPKYQPQRVQLVHELAFEAAMDQVAAKNGLDKDPSALALLAKERASVYANVLVSRAAGSAAPSEAQLRAFYDELVAARKAGGQAQGLPDFEAIKASPQFVDAYNQQQFQKAGDAFQKDLKAQVPVTYSDGFQAGEGPI